MPATSEGPQALVGGQDVYYGVNLRRRSGPGCATSGATSGLCVSLTGFRTSPALTPWRPGWIEVPICVVSQTPQVRAVRAYDVDVEVPLCYYPDKRDRGTVR